LATIEAQVLAAREEERKNHPAAGVVEVESVLAQERMLHKAAIEQFELDAQARMDSALMQQGKAWEEHCVKLQESFKEQQKPQTINPELDLELQRQIARADNAEKELATLSSSITTDHNRQDRADDEANELRLRRALEAQATAWREYATKSAAEARQQESLQWEAKVRLITLSLSKKKNSFTYIFF